jgi:hypothetical protein
MGVLSLPCTAGPDPATLVRGHSYVTTIPSLVASGIPICSRRYALPADEDRTAILARLCTRDRFEYCAARNPLSARISSTVIWDSADRTRHCGAMRQMSSITVTRAGGVPWHDGFFVILRHRFNQALCAWWAGPAGGRQRARSPVQQFVLDIRICIDAHGAVPLAVILL